MHTHVQHTHTKARNADRHHSRQSRRLPSLECQWLSLGVVWQVLLKLACLFPSPDSQSPHPLFKPKLTSPNARGHLDPFREKLKANRAWCGLWSPEYFRSQQQRVQLSRPYSQPGLSLLPPSNSNVWGAGLIKEGHMEKVRGETLAVRS